MRCDIGQGGFIVASGAESAEDRANEIILLHRFDERGLGVGSKTFKRRRVGDGPKAVAGVVESLDYHP